MCNVCRYQKALCICLCKEICAGWAIGQRFDNALDSSWEEVAPRALTEQRPNFFVVKETNDLNDAAITRRL